VGYGLDEKRILLVYADKNLIETHQTMLVREGYCVEIASTVEQAICRAGKSVFDLVFLDSHLPDGKGSDVARKIRDKEGEMGIVMTTSLSNFQNCIDTLDVGMDDILLKPFSPEELLRVVRETFSKG
jgi:DNA-binding response OmpR family regulator